MMSSQKRLVLAQLDRKLELNKGLELNQIPNSGWVHTIRTALNMTLEQLGRKLEITKQAVKHLEEREYAGAITLKSLKEVGDALEMHFVYGFVPKNGSVDKLVEMKSRVLANKIVLRTHQTMQLENQGVNENRIQQAIEELTMEIKREIRRSIWD